MKVLWVCNVMLPAVAEHLHGEVNNKEGWLAGLSDTLLTHSEENEIELHVAFPVGQEMDGLCRKVPVKKGTLHAYGFYEDTAHPENYDPALEGKLSKILDLVKPDVIHLFGTEFAHALALFKVCKEPEKILVGIQGVCQVIAKAYRADLPDSVWNSKSFRDLLKKDSLLEQQEKFNKRGEREKEVLSMAVNVLGRTGFDRFYAEKANPKVNYFVLNETLRRDFYEEQWVEENAIPHSIFMSQGDYPLKGFHYMLAALGELQKTYADVKLYVAGNSLVSYGTLKEKIKISAYGKYLRQLIREYSLEDRVVILGKLTAAQMKERYLKSNVYVCCSANENSPNSLGEAMLLGMPCVAAKVGGIYDLFTEEDGYVFAGSNFYKRPGEYDAEGPVRTDREIASNLAAAVCDCFEKKQETLTRRLHAREHAKITHDPENNYRKLLEIYGQVGRQR